MSGGGTSKAEASDHGVAIGSVGGDAYVRVGDTPCNPVLAKGRLSAIRPAELGVRPVPGIAGASVGYVDRDSDGALRETLTRREFILILGPSLAGKSRTLYETAKALFADLPVIVPDPHCQRGFSRLDDDLPATEAIIWLDDLDRYLKRAEIGLESGLRFGQLEAWLTREPPLHILATIRTDAMRSIEEDAWERTSSVATGRSTGRVRPDQTPIDIIARATIHELPGPATANEVARAAAVGISIPTGHSFGEGLYQARHMLARLDRAEPSEKALVWAAVDWRRIGAWSHLERKQLEALWRAWLVEVSGPLADKRTFDAAVSFATKPSRRAEDRLRCQCP